MDSKENGKMGISGKGSTPEGLNLKQQMEELTKLLKNVDIVTKIAIYT